ncbi:OmpA family protein [Sphingomonas sp. SUN039]|uniref:OmpA family protein n=1 Tax=Sphingomonas sp. SUN039 TaxID=2937787 RepID=UPI0021649B32|nr:OmpA family protein [Sphingomonas sp. SUN039]UVO54155.1 OmpA family protein [Sphingomonas sp. SUN039]
MTKFLIGAAVIALASTAPAAAQILGGGGLGGGLGGVGGSVGGTVGGMVDTTRTATTATDRARDAARQAEQSARRAERQAERQRVRDQKAGLTGSAAVDGMVSRDKGVLSAQGSANGQAMLDAPNLRTRGIAAASARGLRRVAQTSTGVPVFVRAQALPAPVVIAAPVVTTYPVYDRSVYYGGPDVVFLSSAQVGPYMDRQYGDLRRDMQGTGATVVRRGRDLVVQLPADVTFAFDKSDIQPRFYGTLNALARSLDSYRATDVEIVGHTDAIGSEDYNLALSERRGRSVADFLVNRSAEPSRLVVEAMGESEPVATNATIAGRAANRRVEIVLHPREG